jgi:hypothetical protein
MILAKDEEPSAPWQASTENYAIRTSRFCAPHYFLVFASSFAFWYSLSASARMP